MKRGTAEHFKTMRLARLLGTPERPADRAEAIGVLEMLCNHFAPRSAPRGDIGRCTNQEIADGCYTTRDPDHVVRALLGAGWLEEDPEHRLVIHNYHRHADEALRKYLHRHKIAFVTGRRTVSGKGRTVSGQRPDTVDPPRAGTGTGTGSGSSLPEEAKNPETLARARARRQPSVPLPKGFALDAELTDVLREAGCRNPTQGFAAFVAYHRRQGNLFVDWRAAVRTWAGNHERFGCPCQGASRRNGHGPEPSYPDLSAQIAADRERDRRQQEKAKASG